MHEYCCREIYQAFCELQETGDDAAADALKRMVADCPYDSIVGNGYAAVLPLFAECYGRGLKVVHLYRDREACIESLITNCELFPTAYRYYSSSPEAEVKRMAAFHFGEMPREAWERLPTPRKVRLVLRQDARAGAAASGAVRSPYRDRNRKPQRRGDPARNRRFRRRRRGGAAADPSQRVRHRYLVLSQSSIKSR